MSIKHKPKYWYQTPLVYSEASYSVIFFTFNLFVLNFLVYLFLDVWTDDVYILKKQKSN